MEKIKIIIASSTHNGVACAQAILDQNLLEIQGIITPTPKKIGRKQILTKNPLHLWAEEKLLPIQLIEKKLDSDFKSNLTKTFPTPPDFLLVVDFGYFIPNWLLAWPARQPINIHPSALPKYRGASPGQFALLSGDHTSAVSIIEVTNQLDAGPLIYQAPFPINPTWTSTEYYNFAFNLITPKLSNIILDLVSGQIQPVPQPSATPLPLARELAKSDAYMPYNILIEAMQINPNHFHPNHNIIEPPGLLTDLLHTLPPIDHAPQIERASRAFTPWPLLWTFFQGKRLQILKCHLENQKLILDEVKIEGKTPGKFPI